jgi:hypothetical protein
MSRFTALSNQRNIDSRYQHREETTVTITEPIVELISKPPFVRTGTTKSRTSASTRNIITVDEDGKTDVADVYQNQPLNTTTTHFVEKTENIRNKLAITLQDIRHNPWLTHHQGFIDDLICALEGKPFVPKEEPVVSVELVDLDMVSVNTPALSPTRDLLLDDLLGEPIPRKFIPMLEDGDMEVDETYTVLTLSHVEMYVQLLNVTAPVVIYPFGKTPKEELPMFSEQETTLVDESGEIIATATLSGDDYYQLTINSFSKEIEEHFPTFKWNTTLS